MKYLKQCAALALAVVMTTALFTGCAGSAGRKVTKLFDYVVDAGTVTEIDYDFIREAYANGNDLGGGCSAIATQTDDGQVLVGRNMDLYYSNNPAYVLRTAVPGCYETVGVAYNFMPNWPTYEKVMADGLTADQLKELPFLTTDILNSEGLYVEINMRTPEFWVSGDSKFACSGTNEESEERVFVQCVGRYVAEHCATVDEAVEYVAGLNIYTGDTKNSWNYCFLMSDPTGHCGLLEIAENKVVWLDGQPCQTNFYLDEELSAIEEYACGLGRYDYLMSHIDTVQSAQDMAQLMDQVSYTGIYDEDCPFDVTSEFVGTYPWWTNAYMGDEANREEIDGVLQSFREAAASYDLPTKRDRGTLWLSVFTTVANCTNRTMTVRFFEEDDKVVTLSFD